MTKLFINYLTKTLQVIKLNRLLKNMIFLSILLIPLMSIGVSYSSASSNHQATTQNTSPSLDAQVQSKLQANYTPVFFNPVNFGNGTSINVTREVIVNTWKYTTLTDTVAIATSEEAFNAFTYTLPLSFFYKVDHMELDVSKAPSSDNITHELQRTVSVNTNSSDAVVTFVLAPTPINLNMTFTIKLGVNTLVATDQADTSYPFHLSGVNFLPFFNFPITQYQFSDGIQSYDTNRNLENGTTNAFQPLVSDLGTTVTATANVNTATSTSTINYTAITSLPTFNYTTLQKTYTNHPAKNYIPAYESSYSTNMTFPVSFQYTMAQAPIIYSSVDVTIVVDPWGFVNYKEVTTLVNEGVTGQYIGSATKSIPVFINTPDVKSMSVYDAYSNLTSSTRSIWTSGQGYPTNATQLVIAPRSNPLPGSSYTYELDYSVAAKAYMNQTSGFFSPAYNISLPAMSMFNWTNRQVNLKIIFPALSSVKIPDTLYGVKKQDFKVSSGPLGLGAVVLTVQLNNFSMYDNNAAVFEMSMPPVVGPFYQVFYNAFIFFIAGLLLIVIRIAMQKFSYIVEAPSTLESQIPFELMRDFVTAYEEKTALRSRLADLEKKKKNLRKVEFEQRSQTLKNKQIANDKKLISITADLSKVSAVYRESIKSLELAEAERDQILSQIADLDAKKKAQRIRPEIYNKLKNEQNNRLNKAITRIERVLNELRSLLREAK